MKTTNSVASVVAGLFHYLHSYLQSDEDRSPEQHPHIYWTLVVAEEPEKDLINITHLYIYIKNFFGILPMQMS